MPAKIRDYYDRYWSPSGYFPDRALTARARELLEEHAGPGRHCLDYGCGDGQACGVLLAELAASYVGVDVSEAAVGVARATGLDARVVGDGEPLPFGDHSFDLVVCIEVLEHLFDPAGATSEILRVLRPGGVLIATVPNVAYWRRRVDLALLGRWNPLGDDLAVERPWRDPHIRFYTLRALRELLERTGFREIEAGGHDGSLVRDVPVLRRLAVPRGTHEERASRAYRGLERRMPALLGTRLHAVARKPR